jgi:hypothetical protein
VPNANGETDLGEGGAVPVKIRRRTGLTAALLAGALWIGMVAPASATIHEMVASFCSGGHGNVFPPGQSAFGTTSFLRALQASGTVTILPDTPTVGAITIDYNNDAHAGKFTGSDVFVEAIPGVWIEVLEPDHAAFDHCVNFAFGG